MATVTYQNQPAIHATRGTVPIAGTKIPYTVTAVLWPGQIEGWLSSRLIGRTLHACSGKSGLGDCRLDLHDPSADLQGDAARLPFSDAAFDTVLCDPPYNGVFQWNHDMLSELARVAGQRIIFQHWFMPIDRQGRFKKAHRFRLSELAAWQPRTYFGRAQLISVLDSCQERLL